MSKPMPLKLTIFDTGHCTAQEHLLMQGGKRQTVRVHATAALIEHPSGPVLFDTGYAPRVIEALKPWPFSLYALATPIRTGVELSLVNQLAKLGVDAGMIRTIIISHFHVDHIGGLHDFRSANFIASHAAWQDVSQRHGLRALARAFVPALIPEDFHARLEAIDTFKHETAGALGPTHDLFGDRTIRLVQLPGHARGQIGALVYTERGTVLLAADACFRNENWRHHRPSAFAASLFIDNRRAARATLQRLTQFAEEHPETAILPTHCPETLAWTYSSSDSASAPR